MKSRRRGNNGMACRKILLQRLTTELAATKRACDELTQEQQQRLTAEQVLVDTILQLEEVINFKARIQAMQKSEQQQQTATPAPASVDNPQQQQHSQNFSTSRYVTQLLARVIPGQVQEMFTWSAQDWSRAFQEGHTQLPMLLDLVAREDEPTKAQTDCVQLAEQQMYEAVDTFITRGVLGCIYLETVGAVLGACAATNQITQQLEAPPPQHWQHVADRMQLTRVQLQQLAAGYKNFLHNQKMQQQAQLAVAQLMNSPNGCSVQLLAAAKEVSHGNSHAWNMAMQQPVSTAAAGAAAASTGSRMDASEAAGAAGADVTTWGAFSAAFEVSNTGCSNSDAVPASPAGNEAHAHTAAALAGQVADNLSFTAPGCRRFAGADVQAAAAAVKGGAAGAGGKAAALSAIAAAVQPAEGDSAQDDDPITLVNELMGLLNRSSLALHLLLFNTLTHRQLARMVVASYPFLPRAGALIEAATAHMGPQNWLEEQSAEAVAAAAAAAATSRDQQLSWQFSQRRAALLRTQCRNWWLD